MSWETFWLGAKKQKAEKQQKNNLWKNIVIIITNNIFEHIVIN